MKKQLLIICTLLQGLISYAQEDTLTTANGYYTAKCGVTSLTVNAWGAGGGGGRATNSGQTNGGGGGGAFAATTIPVSAGDMIPYQVGQGGSGGDNNKDGGQTWFYLPSAFALSADGGKGVSNNTLQGGLGGLADNSIGTVRWSGGSGGNGSGDGAIHGSGGGGGAARRTANGGNGQNGTTGNIFAGGNGGNGGSSTIPGGAGGNGAGSNGEGNSGNNYGGGGGGAKQGAAWPFSQDGGKGAPGVIYLSYTLPTGTPPAIQAAASLSSNPGTSIGCNETQVTLTATGGNTGNGVSTLWYEGNSCPSFKYIDEFMKDSPSTYSGTALNTTLLNGNRLFTATATNVKHGIDMTNVLGSPVDVSSYKYITVRYRVINSPSNPNNFEIYFKKGALILDETRKVSKQIITDGLWHIINIDMTHPDWNNIGGIINGWRFDYATVPGTKIEIDYLVLGDTPILENTNPITDAANPITDAAITLTPTALFTTYGAIRISDQEGACNGGIPTTTCTQTEISRIDKTYNVTSGNWSTATNWSPGNVLPNENNCVNIQSGKDVVVDVENAQAGRLNVENGGKIKISADKALYVQNGITNNDPSGNNFVVESDANLIQLSNAANTGKITVERSVINMDNVSTKMDYVYWSSPVAGQLFKGATGFSNGTPANRIYQYNESTDYFVATNDAVFSIGKGYAIQAETSGVTSPSYGKTYQFVGTPNNGEFSIPIKRTANSGATVHGYNLIGNPYPSNIDFDVLYEANNTIIYNQAWFWTNTTFTADQQGQGYSGNNYRVYNATGGQIPAVNGIIKVGQGFIVQSQGLEGSTSTFNFKNNHLGTPMRVANPGTFYQKNTSVKNRFWLKLISPNDVDNTQLIGYVDGATDGFEMGYDAEAFGMSSNLFYSILEDKQLLIQGKSAQFSADDHINLGANFFRNSSYTIELEQPEGIFANGQIIYLKDKLTGTITDLSQGSYTFEANKGVTDGRFEIIYKPETVLVTDSKVKDAVVVYRDSDHFVIKSPKTIMNVEVYDISGKLITVIKANNTQATLNAAFFTKGMYLLRIKAIDGEIINKKIIKQ